MVDKIFKTRFLEVDYASREEKNLAIQELFSAVSRYFAEELNSYNAEIIISEHQNKHEWWAQAKICPILRAADGCAECGSKYFHLARCSHDL